MCGFTGFYSETIDKRKTIIKEMNDKIIHRGPDSEGYYCDEYVAFGFRRLSFVDVEKGSQPIHSKDKSKVIMFNGEIYNYIDIRKDLIAKGHEFVTDTDTEVILVGYEEYGKDILHKLRGMFSFVIWDKDAKQLFGARDHFGIKPFYYYKHNNEFLFGSEIKSFMAYPKFEKKINKNALKQYLVFQYPVLEESFFENVFKLRPGHCFTYKNGIMDIQKYFEIKFEPKERSLEEYVNLIQKTVEESVKLHTHGEEEVGAFLSGGVDSSYVVSQAMPNKTFSVGFENDGFDETVYAKEFADMLGIQNKSKIISKDEFFDAIPLVQYYSDEPHANLSSVPLYFLSKLASEDVSAVLSGEGADELFAGYNEYEEPTIHKLYAMLPMGLRRALYNRFKDRPHFSGQTIIKKYGQTVEERYIGQAKIMSDSEANNILSLEYKNPIKSTDLTARYYKDVENADDITKRSYVDMHMWIVDDILLKADKMTSANSIEGRTPLLDLEMWNLARQMPSKYKVHGNITKYAFRLAAEKNLPADWAKRRKAGFLVPFVQWIKEEKYYTHVKERFNQEYVSEFFNVEAINKLLENHYKGITNEGRKIYTIYAFLIWYDQYFIKEAYNV